MDRVISRETRQDLQKLDRVFKLYESGEVRINHEQKIILKRAYHEMTGGTLNLNCGMCIAKAIKGVSKHLKQTSNPFVDASERIKDIFNGKA